MSSPVVLYRYSTSPFAQKVDNILLLKGIPHKRVKVSYMPPRPELAALGISYRRIPVLAVGNDVYCDTALIASALERRFPPSAGGHGTLFPRRKGGGTADTGMVRAFSQFYVDRMLFGLAAATLDLGKMPAAFIRDRNDFRGAALDPTRAAAGLPRIISTLSAHLALAEEQLADGREWLFDTELPGLADISVHFVYAWIRPFGLEGLFDARSSPRVLQWAARMQTFLAGRRDAGAAPCTDITGAQAAGLVVAAPFEPYGVVGFDAVEAKRLGVREGGSVAVAPDDTGRSHPTVGKLVGLSKEEIVIEVKSSSGAVVRCHFPRLGFTMKVAPGVDGKL